MRFPINISYKFNLGKDWSISPSAGVNYMINLSQDERDYNLDNGKADNKIAWTHLMEKDGSYYPWKTSEFRWQAGLNLTYRHVFMNVEYSRGFSRIVNKPNLIVGSHYPQFVAYYPDRAEFRPQSVKKNTKLTGMRNSLYVTLGYSF